MNILYRRDRQFADRCVRCYLTYKCSGGCEFCSAQIPDVPAKIRDTEIEPKLWADGLNRRGRHGILAGGEPFLYSRFTELISLLAADLYKIEIYTNLRHPVDEFLKAARGRYMFLASLHPGTDLQAWRGNIEQLSAANHGVRIHVVRVEGYKKLVDWIEKTGFVERFKTALQGDQRNGIKSLGTATNEAHPTVTCKHRIHIFGPDGFRYHCVHRMMNGDGSARVGHISGLDADDWTLFEGCTEFGLCAGCDNNIEGFVYDGT